MLLAPVDRTTALRAPAIRQLRFLAFAGLVVGRHRRGDGVAAHDGRCRRLGRHRSPRRPHVRRVGDRRRPRGVQPPSAALGGLAHRRHPPRGGAGRRTRRHPVEPYGVVRAPRAVAAAVPPGRSGAGGGRARPGRDRADRARAGLPRGGRATVDPRRADALRGDAPGPAHRHRAAAPARHGAAAAAARGAGFGRAAPTAGRCSSAGCAVCCAGRRPGWRGSCSWVAWPACACAGSGPAPPRWSWRWGSPCSWPASTPSSRWPRRSTTPPAGTRRRSTPAWMHLRHIPMGLVGQLLVAGVAMGVASVPGDGRLPGAVAAVAVVPLALGGLSGPLVSVLSGPPMMSGGWAFAPPEAQGMRVGVPHGVAARPRDRRRAARRSSRGMPSSRATPERAAPCRSSS